MFSGRYPEGEVLFSKTTNGATAKRDARVVRCYCIGDRTEPQILEWRIQAASGERRFIYCPELGIDVLVNVMCAFSETTTL